MLLRKTLGAAGRIVTLKASLTPPGVRNTSCVFPSIANGSCALIWRGETNITGTGWPFTVRQRVTENCRQRNLTRRLADRAQVGAIHGDQATGRDGLSTIGRVHDAIEARRRGARVEVPREDGKSRCGQGDDRISAGERRQSAGEYIGRCGCQASELRSYESDESRSPLARSTRCKTPGADAIGAVIRNAVWLSRNTKPGRLAVASSKRLVGTSDEFSSALPTDELVEVRCRIGADQRG